jgi:hypothetical protein
MKPRWLRKGVDVVLIGWRVEDIRRNEVTLRSTLETGGNTLVAEMKDLEKLWTRAPRRAAKKGQRR